MPNAGPETAFPGNPFAAPVTWARIWSAIDPARVGGSRRAIKGYPGQATQVKTVSARLQRVVRQINPMPGDAFECRKSGGFVVGTPGEQDGHRSYCLAYFLGRPDRV